MPSNDERRQVAARLRELIKQYGIPSAERFYELLDKTLEDPSGYHSYVSIILYLADLIEPEERTCTMTKKGPEFILAGWWECSECGPVYPPCNDEIAVWALQKCPRCGAKVVD